MRTYILYNDMYNHFRINTQTRMFISYVKSPSTVTNVINEGMYTLGIMSH
jgi:hypothetical protein